MINSTELRLGNLLSIKDEILPVCAINSDQTIRFLKDGDEVGCFSLKNPEVQAVPISPDFLLANGFQKRDSVPIWPEEVSEPDGELILNIDVSGTDVFFLYVCKFPQLVCLTGIRTKYDRVRTQITSVHEFQNLYFAATKQEIIIRASLTKQDS
ncbi:MAG TPA: hypothetical protein VK666_26980 [Chryseolinea sp.]|nr:hypothetical protein [Chryseolinea sp.]